MKKTIIALAVLSSAAYAFDDTVWTFENSLNSKTGSGFHDVASPTYGKYVTTETTNEQGQTSTTTTWVGGTATYVDSELVAGTQFGQYFLDRDLGKAVKLTDSNFIKLGDAYWSQGDGALGCGTNYSTSYTLMAWVKFDQISGAQAMFGTGDGGDKGILFSLIDGDKMNLCSKTVADCRSKSLTLSKDTWYNMAVSYDSTTNKVSYYLNGSLIGSATMADRYNNAGGAGAAIGSGAKDTAKDVMSGAIAEFQILNGAYSQEQILKAAGLSKPSPSIPEPTTATLSLLALAGLAARRRRK